MPRDLFGDVVDPGPGLGAHARSAVPLSLVAHAVFAAVVIIVPLMASDGAPRPHPAEAIRATVERPSPPPVPAPAQSVKAIRSPRPASSGTNVAPRVAPPDIGTEIPTTITLDASLGPVAGFDPGAIGHGAGLKVPELSSVTQPYRQLGPQRTGGVVKTPLKVRHVPPIYPAIAQQARVEGVVIIEAIVGVDGRVMEARVLRSKPLLDEAALAAVRQWEFTATTLNGVPVPVIMTVTVNFTLR